MRHRNGVVVTLILILCDNFVTARQEEPPLPALPATPIQEGDARNPLLDFELPATNDLWPTLEPFEPEMPGLESVPADLLAMPEPELPKEFPPEKSRIMALAVQIAPAVLSLRTWDEYGEELASGCGCFVSRDGIILTDIGLVHPSISSRIAYMTATTADGRVVRVLGVLHADLDTGITLLKTDATATTPLSLAQVRPTKALPVTVLGVHESRGLILADASMQVDPSVVGAGWFQLTGKDSVSAVGSPVLDEKGRVIAVVSMRVRMREWLSFASPVESVPGLLARKQVKPSSLSSVAGPDASALAQDPEFIEAFKLLETGKASKATRKLLQTVRKFPRSAEAWAMLGLAAAYMGDKAEAIACQQRAVALDPTAGVAWRSLAMAKIGLKSSGGSAGLPAAELLKSSTDWLPGDPNSWALLGFAHLQEKNFRGASDAFSQVAKLVPNDARSFYLLGFARAKLQDWRGAEVALREAVAINAKFANAWITLGKVLQRTSRLDEALRCFDAATTADPTDSSAWLHLAHAQRRKGNQPSAAAAFRRYKELEIAELSRGVR